MIKKIQFGASALVIQVSQFIKISYIIGSCGSFFSLATAVAPVVGVIGGVGNLALFLFIKTCLMVLLGITNPFMYLFYHSSALFASAYWLTRSLVVRLAIPLLAITIFCLHPQGSFFYAMLWLIPIITAFFAEKNIWLKALGSTFTAHAVGSIVYLLMIQSIAWDSIIPIALVERSLFAGAMVIFYKVVCFGRVALSSFGKKIKTA